MASSLVEFDRTIEYDISQPGITVDTTIGFSERHVSVAAKIDTGSSICIFERRWGEALGVPIEDGLIQRVATATGIFTTFGFRVTLGVAEMEFDSLVYFAADEEIRRNVLGRHGWLELVKLGLIDYEGLMYLSRYSG